MTTIVRHKDTFAVVATFDNETEALCWLRDSHIAALNYEVFDVEHRPKTKRQKLIQKVSDMLSTHLPAGFSSNVPGWIGTYNIAAGIVQYLSTEDWEGV